MKGEVTMKRIAVVTLITTFAFALAANAGEIRKRQENQQDRIAAGVANGSLTPRETVNLERKEARLNSEVRDFREDNGGKLTPRQFAKINRQLNGLSRNIYRDKHNGWGH
jgi:hypothetical protein